MNLQMINMRSKCCRLLKETNITKKATNKCEETVLLKNLEIIKNQNISSKIAALPESIQILSLQEENSLQYMIELLKSDIGTSQITQMLDHVQMKDLMKYAPEEVRNLLCLKQNNEKYIGIYLKYYRNDGLSDEEMLRLWGGLTWFRVRRANLTDEWLGDIGERRSLFLEPIITNNFVQWIEDYDGCLKLLAERADVVRFLNDLYQAVDGRCVFDENNLEEICDNTQYLEELWSWLCEFFEKGQLAKFLPLWFQNHALVYDLELLKKKVHKGKKINVESLLISRASYIAFFYDEELTAEFDKEHEELMIYAITHKKKAFLNLVRENITLYQSVSSNSVLFQRVFYDKCLNVNTMNIKNLAACKEMRCSEDVAWALLAGREHTFEELALIYSLSEDYVRLYESFSARRTDERIRIMREIVKKQCLPYAIRQEELSKNLVAKPLSQWMQQDFGHIEDLSHKNAMCLLSEYEMLARFIPDMANDAEVRYVWHNLAQCQRFVSMEEIRRHSLEENDEWKYLVKEFAFSEEFIEENQERIRKFIFEDGAHIMKTYCESQKGKQDALRRLTSAELMGRFRELKYYQDDLLKEIDFPITERQKKIWIENSRDAQGEFIVWEEDGLLPVMQIGVKPYRTCLSYDSGSYKQCLLACHDSNKKVLYLSYKGKVVLRAAIRLTKGRYGEFANSKEPQLQFADFMESTAKNGTDENKSTQEVLTLFIERAYISGLPERVKRCAHNLILHLMRRKAKQMKAVLVASIFYLQDFSEEFRPLDYSMYISKSKAGEQYLDSLGGSNCVDTEGSYKCARLLVDKMNA